MYPPTCVNCSGIDCHKSDDRVNATTEPFASVSSLWPMLNSWATESEAQDACMAVAEVFVDNCLVQKSTVDCRANLQRVGTCMRTAFCRCTHWKQGTESHGGTEHSTGHKSERSPTSGISRRSATKHKYHKEGVGVNENQTGDLPNTHTHTHKQPHEPTSRPRHLVSLP